jgi:hypothetical protein
MIYHKGHKKDHKDLKMAKGMRKEVEDTVPPFVLLCFLWFPL